MTTDRNQFVRDTIAEVFSEAPHKPVDPPRVSDERLAQMVDGARRIEAWDWVAAFTELQSLRASGGVTVKGLGEWRRGYCDERVTIEQASFGGLYQVRVLDGVVNLDWPDRQSTVHADVGEAKAAALADYTKRILSAIEPAGVTEMVELKGAFPRVRGEDLDDLIANAAHGSNRDAKLLFALSELREIRAAITAALALGDAS